MSAAPAENELRLRCGGLCSVERDELLAWFDSRAMVHRSALAAAAHRAVDFSVDDDDDGATATAGNV
jgi:hypothetical protein